MEPTINNTSNKAGLLFLLTIIEKKIDNTSKFDDNNFGLQCDYVNNIPTHSSMLILKKKKASFVTTTNVKSFRFVVMIITMVKNNQIQVYDGVLHMLVDGIYSTGGDVDCESFQYMLVNGIYSTGGDVDCESFHIVLKSNYHDWDDAQELAFVTKYKTSHDNNQCTTYQVHQSLFYNYGVDTDSHHDHILPRYKDDKCNNMIFPFLLS